MERLDSSGLDWNGSGLAGLDRRPGRGVRFAGAAKRSTTNGGDFSGQWFWLALLHLHPPSSTHTREFTVCCLACPCFVSSRLLFVSPTTWDCLCFSSSLCARCHLATLQCRYPCPGSAAARYALRKLQAVDRRGGLPIYATGLREPRMLLASR